MNDNQLTQKVEKIVAELLNLLEMQAVIQVDIEEAEGRKYVNVDLKIEDGSSELIGQRGKTLESLASVITMMLPASEERYSVIVDINGYRSERSKYVADMAQQAAAQAIEGNRVIEMAPMKAWERRIVHSALTERTDIITESIGEEPERRVVVRPA